MPWEHKLHVRSSLALFALTLSVAGCTHHAGSSVARTAPILHGDHTHPGATKGWVDTKLYFGLGPAEQPDRGVSDAEWRAFLDREITPRFPNGLSVADIYGQWQGKGQAAPERLRSKCVIIDYPDTAENRAKVEAIRLAWKQMTGDQSVLRVTGPVDLSF
ncbi:MAG: DUF3574 domain-containing protein [Acidobacteria bacterium]|nr:DUF3574 domain-containing protein [Acidobacteriota bacterium]